jgi:hypothetical protein
MTKVRIRLEHTRGSGKKGGRGRGKGRECGKEVTISKQWN